MLLVKQLNIQELKGPTFDWLVNFFSSRFNVVLFIKVKALLCKLDSGNLFIYADSTAPLLSVLGVSRPSLCMVMGTYKVFPLQKIV